MLTRGMSATSLGSISNGQCHVADGYIFLHSRQIMTLPSYAMNQQSFAEMYERWLVAPLFRPFAESVILDLDLSLGESVLDIACGTGIVARVAKERVGGSGRVVGIDISADMLSVARNVAPGIEFREGSAAALPLQDGEKFES